MGSRPDPPRTGDTGTLRGDLLSRFRPWVRQLNRKPYARVVAGLVAAAQADPEFADLYREHFVRPRRDATRELLVRARDRGEIAADTDLDVTLDLLYGPIYHRLLHGHAPLTERFAQHVIDGVIAAIAPKNKNDLGAPRPDRSHAHYPAKEESDEHHPTPERGGGQPAGRDRHRRTI